ncbi:MAG: Alkaline phosphatase synthesis transcriptional regulatory protein PhoP [Firmicutes bacterium ADurb.Bin373]|nr:response regulator transcription factor [Bacillota bacterium]OQA08795.1 MAG: Alkaline phosphatase synthesis transcriptional regulatory protein PhoP [Firmicutes bacterium ADurb.Bin373]
MSKILLVEDEKNILELVRFNLEREGFEVISTPDGACGLEVAREELPDLIILDVMLPGMNGLEVCRELQQDSSTRFIPVIILSARAEELDRVLGLEMGADDYIVKPFSPRELVARVRARLRRSVRVENQGGEKLTDKILEIGRLVIDEEKHAVYINGVKKDLTQKEFELLCYLARRRGKVFTREQLLEEVWGYDNPVDSRTIDVHIRHIRQKLEPETGAGELIETVRGVGYRFKEDS